MNTLLRVVEVLVSAAVVTAGILLWFWCVWHPGWWL